VQNYDAGDEIFLFGYSRGAYTIRALAGMLNNCGILPRDKADLIPKAFNFYKKKSAKPSSAEAGRWRRKHAVDGQRGVVHFLGAWDTVGALGIPTRSLAFVEERDLFFDPELGSNVLHARHAVAIDEKRADFSPTLWTGTEARDIRQVWFAGVHGDIGGGNKASNGRHLSDIALAWMAAQAGLAGLALEPHLHGSVRNHHRIPISRSYRGFYRVLGKAVRQMPDDALLHRSVAERYRSGGYPSPALQQWLAANDGEWRNLVD